MIFMKIFVLFCIILFPMQAFARDLDNGTLLFLKNGRNIVQRYTHSKFTHVGMVFNIDGEPWLYEATPPKVRRIKLSTYYEEVRKFNAKRDQKDGDAEVWIYRPIIPYRTAQVASMRSYLDSQLGRKYSVSSYLFGEFRKGCHCSELMSETLNRSGLFRFGRTFRMSPGDVAREVGLNYDQPTRVMLRSKLVDPSFRRRLKHRSIRRYLASS